MKIALCLFGNVGHKQAQGVRKKQPGHDAMKEAFKPKKDWTHPAYAFKRFKQFIIDPYDADVFIHSWSKDFRDDLLKMYSPKGHEIVSQVQFNADPKLYGIDPTKDIDEWPISESAKASYKLLLPSRKTTAAIATEMAELSFRTESRWWSSKKALERKKIFEDEIGPKYDFVVLSRLDTIFKKMIPFNRLDPTKFYGSRRVGRPDDKYAYFDFWFISGTENMDKFATLYDNRHQYSIRPTFAAREHVIKTMGPEAVSFLFQYGPDYTLAREL